MHYTRVSMKDKVGEDNVFLAMEDGDLQHMYLAESSAEMSADGWLL